MIKIDLDFFEKVIFVNALKKDSPYLASCIDYLEEGIFKDKNIGCIIGIIKDFFIENDVTPTNTELKIRVVSSQQKDKLENAVKAIRGLDVEYAEEELIRNTEHFIRQRKLEALLEKAIDERAKDKQIDMNEFQIENEKIHSISLIDNLGLEYFADSHRVVEYLQEKQNVFSTGYVGFDTAIGGGFFEEGKQFGCIGGETNVGKSIVLANIICNVLLQGKHVLLYTLEMSEMRYAKRISSILTGIAMSQLDTQIDNINEYIEDFKSKYQSRLIIKEFPTKGASAKTLLAHSGLLKRRKAFEPNLIAFDYHALLRPSTLQQAKHSEIQYITQECRGLTYNIGAPGISVAQLNRSSHRVESPGLNTISGSWDSIADEDFHANIWQTDEDREASILRYVGAKVRDGDKGHTGFWSVDYNTLRLHETRDTSTLADVDIMASGNMLGFSLDDI
jgi:replicative DNA helicase